MFSIVFDTIYKYTILHLRVSNISDLMSLKLRQSIFKSDFISSGQVNDYLTWAFLSKMLVGWLFWELKSI